MGVLFLKNIDNTVEKKESPTDLSSSEVVKIVLAQ